MACPRCKADPSTVCKTIDCDICGEWCPCSNPPSGPLHYQQGTIEPLEFILANPHLGWCEANAIKYLYRWRAKGGLRDLEKAADYLRILIEKEKAHGTTPHDK